MDRMMKMFGVMLLVVLLMSCESRITEEQIVGRWELLTLDSEINGTESAESLIQYDGEIFYEYCSDSTYVLNDIDWRETGLWVLRADSMLGTLPDRCEDDSVDTEWSWAKIESLNDSVMVKRQVVRTDYGEVEEVSTYVRRSDK